ncbi:hypothetical protein TNCV_434001 [Trichonephila clavipes]|nr:hypothetical protein TNCV_434001 [Trichonephila clavipes]
MANYYKCPLYPKPRKGTKIKTNHINIVNSIVSPNTSYAQIIQKTFNTNTPQQLAPHDTTATENPNVQEITTSIPITPHNNNNKNESLNLITQMLQQTILALTQLVQQISYMNISEPTPPPVNKNKNKTEANVSKSNIKKAILELCTDYLDDDEE